MYKRQPIGGDNTNCVIAGHRGWRGADYFRHIDRLHVGDTVTLTNLWETLTYTVADIQIIQPHEVDKIKIQQSRDLLTLLTCHPYAGGGRQRYVVYCERICLLYTSTSPPVAEAPPAEEREASAPVSYTHLHQ